MCTCNQRSQCACNSGERMNGTHLMNPHSNVLQARKVSSGKLFLTKCNCNLNYNSACVGSIHLSTCYAGNYSLPFDAKSNKPHEISEANRRVQSHGHNYYYYLCENKVLRRYCVHPFVCLSVCEQLPDHNFSCGVIKLAGINCYVKIGK